MNELQNRLLNMAVENLEDNEIIFEDIVMEEIMNWNIKNRKKNKPTVKPELKGAHGSFKKSLISRTSLKSNLKHRSTSILRKEWRRMKAF